MTTKYKDKTGRYELIKNNQNLYIIKYKKNFYMFFCKRKNYNYKTNKKNSYKLYYSISKNLLDWSISRKITLQKGLIEKWNNTMQCYPFVFEHNNKIYIAFSGNYFGKMGFGIFEIKKN